MTSIVEKIVPPAVAIREAIGSGPTELKAFHAAFSDMRCLDHIEQAMPPAPKPPLLASARIVFWNAERLKYLAPSIAMLSAAGADAHVLCELDLGMARSRNIHTTAGLAQGHGAGYIFAVEFVELGLGDNRERTWHKTEMNTSGLHGAGLLSRHVLKPKKPATRSTTALAPMSNGLSMPVCRSCP